MRHSVASLAVYLRLFLVPISLAQFVTLAGGQGSSLAATVRNIATYGATANDGIDDLSAITAAINDALPGDTVYLPSGAFSISGSIVAKSGIIIAGAGRDNTIVQFIGASGNPMISLANVSNVEVAGLTLDGNNNNNAWQGINAANGSGDYLSDLRVENLVGSNFGPHGIYFSSGVTDSQIIGNEFSNIGTGSEWGAGIRFSQGSSRNQAIGNTITNTGRGGILANNDSTDLVIRNNTIKGSGGVGLGIEVWHGCDRAVIENNNLDHWLSVEKPRELHSR